MLRTRSLAPDLLITPALPSIGDRLEWLRSLHSFMTRHLWLRFFRCALYVFDQFLGKEIFVKCVWGRWNEEMIFAIGWKLTQWVCAPEKFQVSSTGFEFWCHQRDSSPWSMLCRCSALAIHLSYPHLRNISFIHHSFYGNARGKQINLLGAQLMRGTALISQKSWVRIPLKTLKIFQVAIWISARIISSVHTFLVFLYLFPAF